TSTSLEKPGDPCASQPLLVHFARNEDGVITLFSIVMMLLMLMVAGIGVDLMQNEMRRTTLQNTIDRAVLAAADLDQTRPATDVVEDYFNKTGLSEFLVAVNPDVSIGSRNVTAEAFMRSDTQFMSLLGVDTLPVPAYSQAIEDVPNVEISLVLDYSQSMASNSRIENLHFAAKAFIDIVLAGSAQQATSINLVPYAGQVNPGPWMFNRLGGTRYSATALDQADGGIPEIYSHVQLADGETGGVGSDPTLRYVYPNTSSCLEFADGAFARDDLPVRPYEQTPYFDGWSNPNNPLYYSLSDEEAAAGQSAERVTNEYGVGVNEIGFGWCPEDITDILYASNNATELKRRIEGSPMYDGTGTPYGMKWGLALLNPAVQYLFNEMSGASVGLVSPEFA
ncbi:MAG: TadE/TadG family type IV pilus assembly protein, partial [Tateyamaria sp.]